MKKGILIITLVIYTCTSYCQENTETIEVKGVTTSYNISNASSKLADVSIHVYKYNKFITTFYSNKKGEFEFDIPKNSYITLAFEKENFIVKRILFDTRIENEKKINTQPFDLEVALLENIEGIDYSDLDFPITIIEYIKEYEDFSYSEKYTNLMLKKQEEILLLVEDKLLSKK